MAALECDGSFQTSSGNSALVVTCRTAMHDIIGSVCTMDSYVFIVKVWCGIQPWA